MFYHLRMTFDPDIVGLLCDNGIKGFVIRCYGAGGIPERARAAFGKVIAKGAAHCRRNRLIILHIALCNPAVPLSSEN